MKGTETQFAKGNLKALMATGGVLAGAGSASQAAIVYTDISDLTVVAGGNLYFSLTGQDADPLPGGVTGGPQLRFYFQSDYSSNPLLTAYGLAAIQGFNAGPFDGFFASRLSAGNAISGANNFSTAGYAFLTYSPIGVPYADWAAGDRGYIGLRVNDGSTVYGWADVSYNVDESVTLYGFAYDTTGGSINAGQIAPVPEPAVTGAIAALLAGSVAAFEARRRRKTARACHAF